MKMKRKRKNACPSPLLDDSPKRTKVHAQRKFAQGSNVNSPVITPIRELESENPKTDILPEPVELLPRKRPNTEDFLTFLCFRGTPILPPSLNFFNTASIVDTNGQVHEIKSENSSKNGPIDIAKCGTSEKPFVAFGVRKRADPVVISRQMDRKRRHALALQALRRKYQEQKMAKIRALTISKLSEKVTNKTLVRTNTVSKTETITKKTNTVQKTKVVATKHIKVTTRTLKTTLKPKMKQNMCLRSFRGRFIQQELPFRKKVNQEKPAERNLPEKSEVRKRKEETRKQSQPGPSKQSKSLTRKIINKIVTSPVPIGSRFTRSSLTNTKSEIMRKQIKRILIPNPNTIIKTKPRSLRLTTVKKSVLSRRKSNSTKIKQKMRSNPKPEYTSSENVNKVEKEEETRPKRSTLFNNKGDSKQADKRDAKQVINKNVESKETTKITDIKKNFKKVIDLKKEVHKITDRDRRHLTRSLDVRKETNKSTDIKKKPNSVEIKKSTRLSNVVRKKINNTKSSCKIETETVASTSKITEEKSKRSTRRSDTIKNVNSTAEKEINDWKVKSIDDEDEKIKGKNKNAKVDEQSCAMKNSKRTNEKSGETENMVKTEERNYVTLVDIDKATISMEDNTNKETNVDKVDESILNENVDGKEYVKSVEKATELAESEKSAPAEKDETKNMKTNERKTKDLSDVDVELPESKFTKQGEEEAIDVEEIQVNMKIDSNPKDSWSNNSDNDDLIIIEDSDNENLEENKKNVISVQKEVEMIKDNAVDDKVSTKNEDALEKVTQTTKPLKNKGRLSDQEENNVPRSQRPSRKTKEAAAIYMEILSHKLVNDNKVDDDDNVSIDSFPELPNVKRTERREIELKAKAKTSRNKSKSKNVEAKSPKEDTEASKKAAGNKNEAFPTETIGGVVKKDIVKVGKRKSVVDDNLESASEDEVTVKPKLRRSHASTAPEAEGVSEEESSKRDVSKTSEIVGESAKSKLRKSDVAKSVDTIAEGKPKRLTRYSLYANRSEDYDSDESFHVNVKVPRKKKNTRSRVSARLPKEVKQVELSSSSSGSDRSTTSDVNTQTVCAKMKNKKFSKTKSMKKNDDFSDSECYEPTFNEDDRPQKSTEKSKDTAKTKKITTKSNEREEQGTKSKTPQKSPEPDNAKIEPKPKRECAKLPQNYLPMFSSSDEDDIFHGFDKKTEKNAKNCETSCSHAPPLLDLLNKDLGRRFGKEKVNMSNEQIEKWLTDAALAGSSIKKENDEMLKFGERIPTETSLDLTDAIDTDKLKESLAELGNAGEDPKEPKKESPKSPPVKTEVVSKMVDVEKPQLDRKLIFRKSKTDIAPNVNAFSPENECSVYAFGEENEDVISTPFRRPSRRPSSTATSKSEDESSKHDDSTKTGHFRKPTILKQEGTVRGTAKEETEFNVEAEDNKQFYVPQNPTAKSTLLKPQNKPLFKSKSSEKLPDIDEFKYKIPSSPSASSSSSAKLYKRQPQKQKPRQGDFMSPVYVSDFPKQTEPAKLVEAPVFHPTEQEFQDPLEYIERIRHKCEQFGICKIIPPSSFKPECKVTDDMRFTAYNQYINKMLYRWGPNFKELMAIKKYLETQNIALNHPPWIGGMEIDLPRLYQTVQTLGGLREVIEKKKWPKVSDLMKIPKSAQDRVTKLDDIYCKYLLPYDILSPAEREKLFDEVETDWAKRESKTLMKAEEQKSNVTNATEGDSDTEDHDTEECTTKGRSMALNAFYRIARNTMSMYFKNNEPLSQEVEQEYWKYVTQRQNHICVHSGSIDCGNWGYGFAVTKNSPFARHPWNLKVLTNNSGSVLRCLGPLMGVTVPTLHVGMVFSACCWYRDPHGLPWIEYLHTGGSKIWYGIPNSMGEQFQTTLKKLTPNYCKNKELWLQSDTVMVPPNLLVENQVSLCHTVQDPGQFVVVFPKAFTSSISTGYVVSESVYFAPTYWLKTARGLFDTLKKSNEPAMFSFDRLLVNVVHDPKCNVEIVRQVLPLVQELSSNEMGRRERLYGLGKVTREKLPIPEVNKGRKKKFQQGEEGDYECEVCRSSLFLSMVFDTVEGITYCLDHAIEMIEKKQVQLENCKFMFTYDDEEIKSLPEKGKSNIDNRLLKKIPNKFAGMPTLLGKQ